MCSGLAWAEAAQAGGREGIHDANDQGLLGADDGECHALCAGDSHETRHVVCGNRHVAALRLGSGAGVAGCYQYFADARRLGEFPGQCVFASTTTNHHDFH